MTPEHYPQKNRSRTTDRVRIFDTTLRDGEQSPGATLNSDEKLEIAKQLARLGVDVIEAGFPASSPDDLKAVQRIAAEVGQNGRAGVTPEAIAPPAIAGMARANAKDIKACWEGVKGARNPCIHIVCPTSDIHLEHKLNKTRAQVMEIARETVSLARGLCDNVEFSAEDATRSDTAFMIDVLHTAAEAGASTLNIPDTVGFAMPNEYGALIRNLCDQFAEYEDVVISAHCHDDLGVGVSNTLAAVANGCRQIEVTINGLGERAGNACLAETAMALHTRKSYFNLETNINLREICTTSKMVSELTGIVVQPNKAIVGANAFSHEAGIHQDGILKNRATYEVIDASVLGIDHSQLVLGKHSGRSALRTRLQELGYPLAEGQLDQAFRAFKVVADKYKIVEPSHLHSICADMSIVCEEPA